MALPELSTGHTRRKQRNRVRAGNYLSLVKNQVDKKLHNVTEYLNTIIKLAHKVSMYHICQETENIFFSVPIK